jgi:hypothetical protein
MTIVVLAALAAVGVAAYRMGRRQRSWGPAAVLLGGLLAGFIEPIYCITMHLWYYRPGQWTMITALGNSQPIWSWLSYCPFYGGLTLLVWWRVSRGATRLDIAKLGGLLFLIGVATELVCIRLGTYEYYGSHPFRVGQFPLWIAVANAAVGIVGGILAAKLAPLLRGAQVWTLVVLVPTTMTMIQFGTGFPTLDAINTPNPPSWLLYVLATVSMGLAATACWCAARLLPGAVARPGTVTRPEPAAQDEPATLTSGDVGFARR